jgi:hypothetical protein
MGWLLGATIYIIVGGLVLLIIDVMENGDITKAANEVGLLGYLLFLILHPVIAVLYVVYRFKAL